VKIFSENEWDPLKEVIIGNVSSQLSLDTDLSFNLFFKDNYKDWGWLQNTWSKIPIKEQYITELNEDLAEFVTAIENENINVHRPIPLIDIPQYNIGGVTVDGMPALNVRDQSIVIGNTIVETAPCQRSRYYENDLLAPIFTQAEGNILKMPKSAMREENFDSELIQYRSTLVKAQSNNYERSDLFTNKTFIPDIPDNIEIMIDGANCVRFGKDIIINIANRNHYLGYMWFKENFPDKNWHPIYSLCDNHLDSFIVPLAEGTLLLRNALFLEQIPDFLKDWKIIYPPDTLPSFPTYTEDDALLTSTFIDMNVLVLGNNRIICNSLYPELADLLGKEGFTPIPVQHRHRRIFAGGFHCFTLDILREK